MSIGSRLKDARVAAHLTQEDLAKQIGVTKGAIANYENGVSTPRIELLFGLMTVLGVDANYLYQDDVDFGPVEITDASEDILLGKIRQLNDAGKAKLSNYADDLLQIDQYRAEKTPLAIAARDGKVVKPDKPIDTDALVQGLSQLEPTENR